MFAFRTTSGPVEVAFTDRAGGVSRPPFDSLNLAATGEDDPADVTANLCRVQEAFADEPVAMLHQVHGADVVTVTSPEEWGSPRTGTEHLPDADGLVTDRPGVTLLVRVADCVPVLLADPQAEVVGALHVGRPGLVAGTVEAGLRAMTDLGADPARVEAWVGPHVCGGCYEVPEQLADDVATVVPASRATTTWGTPSVDLGAGVLAQLADAGVRRDAVTHLDRCTREDRDLFSYRRDGAAAGRLAGLVRLTTTSGSPA